ncbi:hypothetical protein CSE16_08705 [Solibacillus sp. R5-41]|uniref:hypothetical protein n=1 Tax=Solibacillus sp. R5-41 TaxID=2048654 RepID=UPI000C12482F|nr:hypothetical protein [Solibacillus sp. R5-41]ATP40124.1 hypothetical protein CSE16_08705 [Solibacillus sp. R5-41]
MKLIKFSGLLLTAMLISACGNDSTDSTNPTEKVQEESSQASSNDPTEEEWQASYRKIALSEADRYIELTEKNGTQEADRLESYSGVIKQQAEKMTDATDKEKFIQLADIVLSDKLEEAKALKAELEQ